MRPGWNANWPVICHGRVLCSGFSRAFYWNKLPVWMVENQNNGLKEANKLCRASTNCGVITACGFNAINDIFCISNNNLINCWHEINTVECSIKVWAGWNEVTWNGVTLHSSSILETATHTHRVVWWTTEY